MEQILTTAVFYNPFDEKKTIFKISEKKITFLIMRKEDIETKITFPVPRKTDIEK